jgi:hypothetical protein
MRDWLFARYERCGAGEASVPRQAKSLIATRSGVGGAINPGGKGSVRRALPWRPIFVPNN